MDTNIKNYSCPVEVTIEAVGGKWKCLILIQPDAMLIDLTSLNDNEAHLLTTQVKLKQVGQKMAMVAIVLGNNSGERGRAFKMGFAVHIPKPVETIEMVSTLASLIGKDM